MTEQDIVTRARESLNEIGVYYVQTLIVGRNLDDDTTILVPTRALEFVQVAPDLIRELIAKIESLQDELTIAVEKADEAQADNENLRNELDECRLNTATKIAKLNQDHLRELHQANAAIAGSARNLVEAQMVLQSIRDLKVGELSPLDALTTLFELQRKAKGE